MTSLAETARIAVELLLKDKMSAPLAQAKGELAGLDRQTRSTATGSFARLQSASTGVSGALKHAGEQMKHLALGFGIGAGIVGGASIVGFFEQGIDKAREFGSEVARLAKITGMTIPATSAMAAALEHFGVGSDQALRSIGFLEKNVGLLAAKKDGIVGFEKQFGFALRDSNGHLKNANDLLLTAADYFNNKSIPATTKAAALSKLFGRSWQELIPVLGAGSKGIKDAADEAERLGLTLNKDNVADLAKLKTATREWQTSLGGLQLQLGLLLVGPLTDLSNAATKFISNPDNRRGILGFFKGVLETAKTVGGVLANTVIPALSSLAGTAKSFWDGIPGPLRDLLVKAVAGDRIIKFAFGFSPIEFALGGLKGALGGLFQRGGSPANPMFVKDVTGGLGGGGTPGEGGGGMGKLGKALAIASIVTDIVAVVQTWQAQTEMNSAIGHGLQQSLDAGINVKTPSQLQTALDGVNQGINDIQSNPLNVLVSGDALDTLRAMRDELKGKLANSQLAGEFGSHPGSKWKPDSASAGYLKSQLTVLHQQLAEAKKDHNVKLEHKLTAEIHSLKAEHKASIAKAAAEAAKHAARLKAATDQVSLKEQHLIVAARAGKAATDSVKDKLVTANTKLATIARKPTKFSITIPINATTSVSVRDTGKRFATSNRYSSRSMLQAS